MDIVLCALRKGKSEKEAFECIKKSPLIKVYWMNKGLSGEQPYKYFLDELVKINVKKEYKELFNDKNSDEYQLIKNEKEEEYYDIYEDNFSEEISDLFIESIKNELSIENSDKLAKVQMSDIKNWIEKGRLGQTPYKKFYRKYTNAIKYQNNKKEKEEERIKIEVINLIKDGYGIEDASIMVDNAENKEDIIKWFELGRIGNKEHLEFYKKCNNILLKQDKSKIIRFFTKETHTNKKNESFFKNFKIEKK